MSQFYIYIFYVTHVLYISIFWQTYLSTFLRLSSSLNPNIGRLNYTCTWECKPYLSADNLLSIEILRPIFEDEVYHVNLNQLLNLYAIVFLQNSFSNKILSLITPSLLTLIIYCYKKMKKKKQHENIKLRSVKIMKKVFFGTIKSFFFTNFRNFLNEPLGKL